MLIERHQHCIARTRVHVIEKEPHPHAAICSEQCFASEKLTGDVAMPEVVLQIEAANGRSRTQHSKRERIGALRDQTHA